MPQTARTGPIPRTEALIEEHPRVTPPMRTQGHWQTEKQQPAPEQSLSTTIRSSSVQRPAPTSARN